MATNINDLPEATQAVLRAINSGECDQSLYTIAAAAKRRETRIAKAATSDLNVGDIVKITGKIRPAYLVGAEGRVTAVEGKNVFFEVTRIDGGRQNRIGQEVGLAAHLLTKQEA